MVDEQQSSVRANEWLSLLIFLIAGYLSDQHDGRSGWSFPKDGLRGVAPQIAVSTLFRFLRELL
jgi:hypothetical protein